MTKKPTVTTISSGYYSTTALNNNFTNIRDEFDNTLSLDGSTPNAMQADLDFNNNNAINIDSLDAQTITLAGSVTDLSDIQALTGISQDIQTLADIEDGTDATDAIQTAASVSSDIAVVSGINSDITTVSGISSDVTTVAGIDTEVTTVAGDSADIGVVSGISADVTTVAADGTDIGVVAGISSDVTTVAADATDIGTVATNITDVTTVASNTANVNTVANNDASVTTVANNDSNITTVANDISAVTTNAANIADINTVASNLTDVTNFADVYLGPSASDPTARNDGSALQEGDLYFNTTSDEMRTYEGTSWTAAFVSLSGALLSSNNLSDVNDPDTALQNLGVTDITAVKALDQGVATTDSPEFAGAKINSPITGTAVQQSADDTTNGRIARFNAPRGIMGLGGTRAIVSTDWNNLTETGFYTNAGTNSNLVGGPGSYSHMSMINMRGDESGSATQIASRNFDSSSELYFRSSNNFPLSQNNWEEIFHTGNTNAYTDSEKSTVANAATLIVAPKNGFIATFFREQTYSRVDFYSSLDGVNFSLLNSAPLPRDGGEVASRDPSIIHFNGSWYVFVTNNADGVRDFVVYKSEDLTQWRRFDCTMGATAKRSDTTPISGGTEPADAIWAPEPFVEDGKLYVLLSVRYGSDLSRPDGGIKHFRQFYCEMTDEDSLTFAEPVIADFGADNAKSLIDWSVIKEGSTYYVATKDNVEENIRIYTGSSLSGPFTFDQVLDEPIGIEAPCWAVYNQLDQSTGAVEKLYRIYVDHNRTLYTDTPASQIVGRTYFFEANSPTGSYGSKVECKSDRSIRHGSVMSLAEADPRAMSDVRNMASLGKPGIGSTVDLSEELGSGTQYIHPQENWIYYVDGTTATDLVVNDGPADRFYIACFSGNVSCGIIVQNQARIPRQFEVGFGESADVIVEILRKPNGQYAPVGFVNPSEANTVEISGGEITVGKRHFEIIRVDTEGSAGSDDLVTINGGYPGKVVILTQSNSGRDVTVKDGTGNIQIFNTTDVALNLAREAMLLYYDGGLWRQAGTAY